MIQTSKRFLLLLAASAFPVCGLSASVGCGAPDASTDSHARRAESVARSSAADTAVWTATYIGDAHNGSIHRRSNIVAKAALVMASNGTNLYLALYFCGKGASLTEDTKWLVGNVALPASGNIADLGAVDLKTADGWKAHVSMTGPGTVTTDHNVTFNWVASSVSDGYSGLYRYVFPGGVDSDGNDLTRAVLGYIQWSDDNGAGFQGALQFADDVEVKQVVPLSVQVPDAGEQVTFPSATGPVTVSPVDPIALSHTPL